MTVRFYKDFSDAYTEKEVQINSSLKDNFSEAELTDKCIIVNGEQKDSEYVIKDGDLILIRSIPHGSYSGEKTGSYSRDNSSFDGDHSSQDVRSEGIILREYILWQLSLQYTTETMKTLPFLKGASNESAKGKTIPFHIGHNLFSPYVLTGGDNDRKGYTSIVGNRGETQIYNLVVSNGYGPQCVDKIYVDDICVCGIAGNNKITKGKFPFNKASIFDSDRSYVVVMQNGQDIYGINWQSRIEQAPKQKISSTPSDNIFELEKYSSGASVGIRFNGLVNYANNGKASAQRRRVNIAYSTDYYALKAEGKEDEATWTNAYFNKYIHHDRQVITHKETVGYVTAAWDSSYIMDHKKDWVHWAGENLDWDSKDLYVPGEIITDWKPGWKAKGIAFEICIDEVIDEYDEYVSAQGTGSDAIYNVVEDLYTKDIRYQADISFTYEDVIDLDYPVAIRVYSPDETPTGESSKDIYVDYIQSLSFDVIESKKAGSFINETIINEKLKQNQTLLYFHIEATEKNEDKLKTIQVESRALARVWNGTVWTEEKDITENVAAWVLEVLTFDQHAHSAMDDTEIDLEAFGAWYEICEEKNWKVNKVLCEGTDKSSVLDSLCALGYGTLYKNIYGKLSVAVDCEKQNAIAVLNPQNIINFSYKKSLKRRTDAYRFTFINKDKKFQEDTELIKPAALELTEDSVIEEKSVAGITNYYQLWAFGMRLLKEANLRPQIYTAEVGKEGIYYTLLSKIKVQHPSLRNGLGDAEIKELIYSNDSSLITGAKLYSPIEYFEDYPDGYNGYGAIIQCIDPYYCRPLALEFTASTEGRITEITFTNPISVSAATVPHVHDTLSYGYISNGSFDSVTSDFIITAIQPTDNGVTLTLKDYNEEIYTESEDLPVYIPNITHSAAHQIKTVSDVITMADLQALKKEVKTGTPEELPNAPVSISAVATQNGINLSMTGAEGDLKDNIATVVYEISKDSGVSWDEIARGQGVISYNFNHSKDGYPEEATLAGYLVRAKCINIYGSESNYVQTNIDTTSYKTWQPPRPTNVKGVAEKDCINITWDYDNSNVYGTPTYSVSKNGSLLQAGLSSRMFTYYFDRSNNEYPEKTALQSDAWEFAITVSNESQKTNSSTSYSVDCSSYLSWLPPVPTCSPKANGRNAFLYFSHVDVYGFSGYEIQISKDKNTWYKPYDGAGDVTTNVDLWKGTVDEYAFTSQNQFVQVLPLEGQNDTAEVDGETISAPNPNDTIYYYRVRSKTITAGEWTNPITLIAQPTSAADLVQKTITNNKLADNCITADKIHAGTITGDKIAATNLAANGAVLGKVSGNAISSNANNFWNLETGEFNIGNSNNIDNPSDNDCFFHYDTARGIVAKIANFVITTIKSVISGIFLVKEVGATDANAFMTVNPTSSESNRTPAKTVNVNGNVKASGFTGNVTGNATTANQSEYANRAGHASSAEVAYSANQADSATNAGTANQINLIDGDNYTHASTFHWLGQPGQPSWIWGGSDVSDMHVYNPSNFNVNHASTADSATIANHIPTSQPDSNPGAIWIE